MSGVIANSPWVLLMSRWLLDSRVDCTDHVSYNGRLMSMVGYRVLGFPLYLESLELTGSSAVESLVERHCTKMEDNRKLL